MTNSHPHSELSRRLLNKVLARLYLELVPEDHPQRKEKLLHSDELFSRKRPPASEMRRIIMERDSSGSDLGSELIGLITGELAVLVDNFNKSQIEEAFDVLLKTENIELTHEERKYQLELLFDDIWGFGPLEPLVHDDAVTEILIDRYDRIYVERHGKFEDIPYHFRDEEHLLAIIHRILTPLGKKVDHENPMVDARLPDGSRVNVVIPPVAINGPSMVIRIFAAKPLTLEDLVRYGSISQPIIDFLETCVKARLNIAVSGGTGSGKTTLLNLIMGLIPQEERIVTVENVTELRPPESHVRMVRLESQAGNIGGEGAISMRDLVINAMRMRPDRLIIGEIRGSEVLEAFQAINTGHDGSMLSIHANSPRDVLTRMEAMASMSTIAVPLLTIRQQLSTGLNIITHQERLPDGTRKVMKVSEVVGMRGDSIEVQDIFVFRRTGMENGRISGNFVATGYIPPSCANCTTWD